MAETKYPYYQHDFKGTFAAVKEWILYEGEKGCIPVEGVCLRYDKIPPPLADSPPPPPQPPEAAKAVTEPPKRKKDMTDLVLWILSEKKVKTKEPKKKEIPTFDLRDIPKAMEAMGWYIAAKLAQRWLDGKLHRIPANTPKYVYPKEFVDTDTVKLSMLLKYRGVRAEYNDLLAKIERETKVGAIENNGIAILKNSIMRHFINDNRRFSGRLNTLEICGGDIQKLHNAFQFQRQFVNTYDGLSIEAFARNGMTEVTASLAAFNFYAAVAYAHVQTDVYNKYNTPKGTLSCTRSKVEITHIYVYARDSYSFMDEGKLSQYLGHWSKTRVIAIPAAFALSGVMDVYNSPMDTGGRLKESEVFTPIRNRDYLRYQDVHQRGGDFVIFSDRHLIPLAQPIDLDMGEICQ